jgi:hypothetical protein
VTPTIETGAALTAFQPGDRVLVECIAGEPLGDDRVIIKFGDGLMSYRTIVAASSVHPLPTRPAQLRAAAEWLPIKDAPRHIGLHAVLIANFWQPTTEDGDPDGPMEMAWAHVAYRSHSGWMLNTKGFDGLHGNASFPLHEATHFQMVQPLESTSAPKPPPTLREVLEEALIDLSNTRTNIMADLAKGNDRWEGVPDLLKARIDGYRAALAREGASK